MKKIGESKRDIVINYTGSHGGADYYGISTEHGNIDASYLPDHGWYTIANFDVDQDVRRNGIGKQLLSASKEHARALGASVIMSAILSRECYDAMASVFGEDNIDVYTLGNYAPEGKDAAKTETSASLRLFL